MTTKRTDPKTPQESPEDASTREIIYYAIGNVEQGVANQFHHLVQNILVIAMHINPLFGGLIVGLKTFVDGFTDPLMAYISDNTKSRWGRRKPYVLVGGILRMLCLVAIVLFFPTYAYMSSNAELAADKQRDKPPAVSVVESEPAASEKTGETPATEAAMAGEEASPPITPPARSSAHGPFGALIEGVKALYDPANAHQLKIVVYTLVGMILFTIFSTISGVPYYAWGIELCGSYDGRTKLTVYRGYIDKTIGITNVWMLPFCFSLIWANALQGLLFIVSVGAVVGIFTTVLMIYKVKEPRRYISLSHKQNQMGLFKSIFVTIKNPNFLRIFVLYQIIGFGNGLFAQVGLYLNVYWVMKGAGEGANLTAIIGTLGWALALLTLPVVQWASKKFQKHITLLATLCLMMVGFALKWFLVTPEAPYLQLILPFFFSTGISCFYTVIGSMLADVTDHDQLVTGQRREAMFAAVMSFLGKAIGGMVPVLAGLLLVVAGFNPALKFDQDPQTILNMRILFSVAPAIMIVPGILILLRYPLNRERMAEIKAELAARRAADEEADKANAV